MVAGAAARVLSAFAFPIPPDNLTRLIQELATDGLVDMVEVRSIFVIINIILLSLMN